MPTVQYIYNGETITKSMLTPKAITKLYHWLKEARKAIPQIPLAEFDVYGNNDWMIFTSDTDPKWIKFDLHKKNGERAYIVILRR